MQTINRRISTRGGLIYLPTDEIEPSPFLPRTQFDDESIRALSLSIAEFGLLNPLTVRLNGERYELIAGARRLKAAKLLGISELPCILLYTTQEEASILALAENLQRRELDPADAARGMQALAERYGMSAKEAARRVGRSAPAADKPKPNELSPSEPAPKRKFIMKDMRVFLNTVTRGVELMKSSGVDAYLKQDESDSEIVLTVTIPKKNE